MLFSKLSAEPTIDSTTTTKSHPFIIVLKVDGEWQHCRYAMDNFAHATLHCQDYLTYREEVSKAEVWQQCCGNGIDIGCHCTRCYQA